MSIATSNFDETKEHVDSIARDVASAIGWVWLGALVCASGIVHNQESLRLEHA